MNCKQFRLQIDSLEGRQDAWQLPAGLQAHLDACPACRAHFQIQQRMLAALENDPAPALPPDFSAKILARLEPMTASGRAKTYFNWRRLAVYAGCGFLIATALWLGFKNFDLNAAEQHLTQWLNAVQQGLAAAGATGFVQTFQRLLAKIFSFFPTTNDFLEKSFGKETLPQAFNLIMILILTYLVAKASVLIESWVRQANRRSS
ncbi:MAG: anti-sigma factor family protein [bacterium]